MAESNIYIDVKPSEQLHTSSNKAICFAGIALGSNTASLPKKFKDFKSTKASAKGETASKVSGLIRNKKLKLYARALIGNMNGILTGLSVKTWNGVAQKLDIEVIKDESGEYFIFDSQRFNLPLAMGLAAYTNILVNFGLQFGNIAKQSNPNINHLNFYLDHVPGATTEGMHLMEQISNLHADLVQLWKENMGNGFTFKLGNLGKWKDDDGKWKHSKLNPELKLVDWIAASCLAYHHPDQLLKESHNLNESDIESIKSIWQTLLELGFGKAILLDNTENLEKLKKFE